MSAQYEDRLRRVLRYIHDNPAGALSLDALADVAAMSRFHWHRVFHAMTGETCADVVRRVRAHRASFWLAQTQDPVATIAARAGYDNTQSFARAFRDIYGVTPLAFRASGVPERAPLLLKIGDDTMYDIDIQDHPARRLAGLLHTGPYTEIGRSFEQLTAVFSAHALWPQARGMVGIYYDDPSAVAPDALKSAAGIVVEDSFEMPSDLQEFMVAPGRHAVLRVHGPYSGLQAAYSYLYGHWLPGSGEEPADAPPFEIYMNSPQDTAPGDLITDICAPLKG